MDARHTVTLFAISFVLGGGTSLLAEAPPSRGDIAPNAVVSAQAWVVETTVEDEKEVSKYVTIFQRGTVYSLGRNPQDEVTIVDPQALRFELLDPTRRLRCLIDGTQLLTAMAEIETRAPRTPDPLVKFAANPQFTVDFAEDKRELRLVSPVLTYHIEARDTPVVTSDRLTMYLDFADWSARLSALHPGGLPAAARIGVNRELRSRRMVPVQIARTMRVKSHSRTATSTHEYRDVLAEDLARVSEIDRQRESFTVVQLSQYFKFPAKSR